MKKLILTLTLMATTAFAVGQCQTYIMPTYVLPQTIYVMPTTPMYNFYAPLHLPMGGALHVNPFAYYYPNQIFYNQFLLR